MSTLSTAREGPMSPCINVCALGADGYCSGCGRSLEEIAAWSRLTAEQQWAVLRRVEERRLMNSRG
jgi:hypothetical protein